MGNTCVGTGCCNPKSNGSNARKPLDKPFTDPSPGESFLMCSNTFFFESSRVLHNVVTKNFNMYAPLFSCPLLSSKLNFPVIKILERHSLKLKKINFSMFLLQENLIWMKETSN